MKNIFLGLILLVMTATSWAVTPGISIWQPANGAVLDPNMWTTLSSGATNASSVTYFLDGMYYCETSVYPYNCGWFTPASGTHSIRAVAKSSDGAEASQIISVSIKAAYTAPAPTVSLWQPANAASFTPSYWTTLSAGATDANSVTWYVNGAQYCVVTASPYNCGWQSPASAGTVVLKVVARNSNGQSAEQSISVIVSAPVPDPTVAIVQPGNGSVVEPNMWTTLSAGATNASSVTYFVNETQHCVVNASPYNCSWMTPASGTVSIRAVARNSIGVSVEHSVSVSVRSLAPAPTVSLWQPSNGTTIAPSYWTTLSSGATNASSVTYYVNGVQHCVVNASPYNCGWQSPSTAGNVLIKVVAKNVDGVSAEQSATVTVSGNAPVPTPAPTPIPAPNPTLTAGVPYIHALPSVSGIQGKPLTVNYQFAGTGIASDLVIFVYFQDMNGSTVIQDDFRPDPGTTSWNGNMTFARTVNLPSNLLKGNYKILAGFYKSDSGYPKVSSTPGPGVVTITPDTVFQIGTLNLPNDPPPIPPSISVTFPTNNMYLMNNTSMNFSAVSDKASRIDFYVNGELICTDSSAPFSCPYTTPNNDTKIKMTAIAVGAANLSSSSEVYANVASSAPALQAPGAEVPAGYSLYFNDEFENRHNGLPNPAFWDYTIDYVINNEAQCYTDSRRENVRVEHRLSEGYNNGYLVLQLRKESIACKQDQNKTYQYTSGSINTRKRAWGPHLVDMPHGRYEIRAKLPAGRGTWPAIWLLGDSTLGGWPDSGEIDIMEQIGADEAKGIYKSYATLHRNPNVGLWPNKWGTTGQGHEIIWTEPISARFHTWTLEWTPTTLTFYMDGRVINRRVVVGDAIQFHDSFIRSTFEGTGAPLGWPYSRETPGHQFKMLLNLAWGGGWGGYDGLDDSIFNKGDVEMLVDYVRIYKKN